MDEENPLNYELETTKDEIEITKEKLETTDWEEVARLLRFVRSTTGGGTSSLSIETSIEIFIDKQQQWIYDKGISTNYGVSPIVVYHSTRMVEKAILALSVLKEGNHNREYYSELFGYNFARSFEIYKGFASLDSFIKSEAEKNTSLWNLLESNRSMLNLLLYLTSGNSLMDFIEENDIPNVSSRNTHHFSEAIVSAVVRSSPPSRNPYYLLANHAFSHWIRTGESLHGIPINNQLIIPIKKVLIGAGIKGRDNQYYFSQVKRFFEIALLVHYFSLLEKNELTNTIFEHSNPYSIDTMKYYEGYKGVIPPGIQLILEHYLENNIQSLSQLLIRNNVNYSDKVFSNYFYHGLRALFNILDSDTNVPLSFNDLKRNRRKEFAEILRLIAENYDSKSL